MSRIIPINSSNRPDRVADILFVHGLNDNALQCWKPAEWNDVEWWPHWVSKEFPEAGVWLADYETPMSHWQGSAMTLPDRARNILEWLASDPDFDGGKRPILFIAHSLGGLVVKQMLRMALTLSNPAHQAIGKQARAVIFLSTPHLGAQLSTLAQNLDRLGIARLSPATKTLTDNDPHLRELNEWYRDNAGPLHLHTKVFVENRPITMHHKVFGVGISTTTAIVVDQKTGDPGLPGAGPVPLDEDHISMCKPASARALVVVSVASFLRETLAEIDIERRETQKQVFVRGNTAHAPGNTTQTEISPTTGADGSGAPGAPEPSPGLTERRELIEAMLKLPQVTDMARRNAIVRELKPAVADNVLADASARAHITNIVTACVELDGLPDLQSALEFYYDGAIALKPVQSAVTRLTSVLSGSPANPTPMQSEQTPRPSGSMGAAQRNATS